ncbi:MAG: F0F1 ATP synthase subunit B [Pseudomonadota bacterium]
MVPAVTLAAAEAGKSGLPQLDPSSYPSQLFWLAITYGLLYLALSRFILPRIGRALDKRRERIQKDIDQAQQLKSQTDEAIATYEKRLGDARGKASAMAKETRDKLAAETDAERSSVEQQVAAKVAEAEQRIATMKASALSEVTTISRDTAGDIVSKLVGATVSTDELNAAIEATTGRK